LKQKTFMLIAGEASGDLLASELVAALREKLPDAQFFGAGGAKMAAAGVELAVDMMQHAMVGIPTPGKFLKLRRLGSDLLALALKREPDFVIGVDYGGFNLRFGQAVKEYVRTNPFSKWNPKIVQFVSPQVWASRPGRAKQIAADYDLLLSIFPFEKDWYAQRVPQLRVEFVGHPMVERFMIHDLRFTRDLTGGASIINRQSKILLLPGSRQGELKHHLPVMLGALKLIQEQLPEAKAKMVLPNPELRKLAKSLGADLEIQIGELPWALAESDVVISKTGTVTMECAFFGVPTVTLYKKSLLGLAMALRIITVQSLTMPNLLAGEEVFPEFIQKAATPENLARATLELLQDEDRRQKIKAQLAKIIASLGGPGAPARAAEAILSLKP
jgi:lipid-A-disaccharide synthase